MSNEKTPGQFAFEAYNESKGGVTYDGKPIPPWSDVGDAVRTGWEHAARSVIMAYDTRLDAHPDIILSRARCVVERAPKSREAALVLTKIDEATMWLARVPMETR